MGFFKDWHLINPLLHKFVLVWPELQTNRVFSFHPRDTMLARYLPSSCVCLYCLSVPPSICLWCSTKMAKPRIMQTMPRDSPETLVFWSQQSLVGDAPFPLKFALKVNVHNDFDHGYIIVTAATRWWTEGDEEEWRLPVQQAYGQMSSGGYSTRHHATMWSDGLYTV